MSNQEPVAHAPTLEASGAPRVELFSTCPSSKDADPSTYLRHVIDVARWSEAIGCLGILVYTDNSLADPWLVSQTILQHTDTLSPLVAVQPLYMHPFTAARMVSTLALLYRRRIYLNMLAGGFRNDLLALNDPTPHDERYARTVEYTNLMRRLLASPTGVDFDGKYYRVENLKLAPPLPAELQPGILISGSSEAGMAAAHAIEGTAVRYPLPPGEESGIGEEIQVPCGIRIGIIARDTAEEAWRVALERFPPDRKGMLAHQLAMKVSDSQWHRDLSARSSDPEEDNPYWLGPFHSYKTFCPYLVGSHERVAQEVANYIQLGYRTIILDIPPSQEELEHTARVFEQALEGR